MLDASRCPRAAAYVQGLPHGLDSFPECEVLAETHDGARELVAARGRPEALPGSLAAFLDGQPAVGWIPEVIPQAAEMLVADHLGDEGYCRWCYDDAMRVFSGPIVRHLMRLVSPTLVVMGARSRWTAVHRGTSLETEPVRREADRIVVRAAVSFPEGHYPELFLRALADSFRAAIDGARGAESRAELVERAAGCARYLVSWRR